MIYFEVGFLPCFWNYYSTFSADCQVFFTFFFGRWGIRTPTLTFSPHSGDTHNLLAHVFGFCILRIPNIISACGVWFTFIFRTQEHHAVEDFVSKDLLALVGTHILWLPCIPHLCLNYNTIEMVCQDPFWFFQKDFFNLYCTLTSLCTRQGFVASFTSHLGCVALIVSQLGRFVKGFGEFFPKNSKIFFSLQDLAAPHWHPYCITTWAICQGVFYIFSRGNTRLLLRLSLRDTHHVVSLPGLSPWHQYIITSRSKIQDGRLHKIGIKYLCNFLQDFAWQIAKSMI